MAAKAKVKQTTKTKSRQKKTGGNKRKATRNFLVAFCVGILM